jgi:hypothetical protein
MCLAVQTEYNDNINKRPVSRGQIQSAVSDLDLENISQFADLLFFGSRPLGASDQDHWAHRIKTIGRFGSRPLDASDQDPWTPRIKTVNREQ